MRPLLFSFFSTLIFLFSLSAHASNYFYLYGGAGEPTDSNMFTSDFVHTANWAQKNHWTLKDVLFDGNNSGEQRKVSSAAGQPASSFTQGKLEMSLSQLALDAQTGSLKKNDQVLIMINDHGQSDKTTFSHQIDCNGAPCDPSTLKSTITQLQKSGIRVAVVDLSCYSGQSLDLADNQTCVVTETTANDVGWNDFSKSFISHMKSGLSLEDVFLQTRLDSPGRAQISSPAGKETTNVIENLASEARYNVSDSHYIPQTTVGFCVASTASANLQKILSEARDLSSSATAALPEAQAYVRASQKYADEYAKVQALGKEIAPYYEHKVGATNWVILAMAGDKELQNFPSLAEAKKQLQKNPEFQHLEKMAAEFQKKAAFSSFYSFAGFKFAPNDLTAAALQTQGAEKKLYDKLYKGYQGHEENPCAKFIF